MEWQKGVELDDGRFTRLPSLLPPASIPIKRFSSISGRRISKRSCYADERLEMEKWSLFDVHLALFNAPQFKAAASNPDLNKALIYALGFETEENLIEHFKALKNGESKPSGFNCCFPTLFDPSEAPAGRHTGLISEHAPYRLKEGGPERWV